MLKRNKKPKLFITCVLLILASYAMIVHLVYSKSNNEEYFRLPLQDPPTMKWCKGLRKISEPRNPVGLVSAPGSGNTWLRYLLQQATGILTGSMHNDTYLHMVGFPGENCNDGSMLVVKNHYGVNTTKASVQFDSVVLLIRNPRDSVLAAYNFEYARNLEFQRSDNETAVLSNFHNVVAPPSVFRTSLNNWTSRVTDLLQEWIKLYTDWLTNYNGPTHVVFYENLINNTRNELQGILDFLNVTVSRLDIACAFERRNDFDMTYRRVQKYKYFDPLTKDMYKKMEMAKNTVYDLIKY